MDLIRHGYNKLNEIKTIFSSLETSDRQILEPLSCIIKLAILSFLKDGTKISISNNKISYQSNNIIQGPLRWSNGDTRDDLHNLCEPIEKAIEWYKPHFNNNIKIIFTHAKNGLIKLKKSYLNDKTNNSNLVCHSISYYIHIINNILEKDKKTNNFNSHRPITQKTNEIESLQHIWLEDEIKIIKDLFDIATRKKNNCGYILKSIQCIINEKDNISGEIIRKLISSYSYYSTPLSNSDANSYY